MKKCDTCETMRLLKECSGYACCSWYLENVVCGNKKVEDCPDYMEEKHNAEN